MNKHWFAWMVVSGLAAGPAFGAQSQQRPFSAPCNMVNLEGILMPAGHFIRNDVAGQIPEGPGAWLLSVASQGGYLGRDGTEFAVDSTGRLRCFRPQYECAAALTPAALAALDRLVQDVSPINWSGSVSIICNDCMRTAIFMEIRSSAGGEHRGSACWDLVTRGTVPADAIEIFDFLTDLIEDAG